jgi:hypothetical protein
MARKNWLYKRPIASQSQSGSKKERHDRKRKFKGGKDKGYLRLNWIRE